MTDAPPLNGLRVVEFAGIGPGPHAAMMLADMGADVIRIDRPGKQAYHDPVTGRGRSSIDLDLKSPAGLAVAEAAVLAADIIIEGFRPGVMERLGLGPDEMLARNPGLIYGRMTGWGQDGPLAQSAGHDINYIALTGALDEIGVEGGPPIPPVNFVGDFGGGSTYLVIGILLALLERTRSGRGQVVDAAIVDGAASLMAAMAGMRELIGAGRGRNALGGASPTYRTYRCADGAYLAIGAIEERFWTKLADRLGLSAAERRRDAGNADALHRRLEALFLQASAAEWIERIGLEDTCIAPVLTLEQAATHVHLVSRGTYRNCAGVIHPAPAPRLSRSPGVIAGPAPRPGEGGREAFVRWGGAMALLDALPTGDAPSVESAKSE